MPMPSMWCETAEKNINFLITDFIMTYESTIFLHVLLIFGIVYLTMLSMLILLTFFKNTFRQILS